LKQKTKAMNLSLLYNRFSEKMNALASVSLLLIRLVLAYGFNEPAMKKLENVSGIAEWFASMNYPLPLLVPAWLPLLKASV